MRSRTIPAWYPVRLLRLVALTSAAIILSLPTAAVDAQIEQTDDIPAFSGDGFANFRTFCEFSHASYNDPLVHPGKPGAAHLHFFFGNTKTNAYSTPESLRAKGQSTCQGGATANRSAYWIPALFRSDGRPMLPDGNNIYYKHLTSEPASLVEQLPAGLQMISGNADGTPESADYDTVYWQCGSGIGERSDTIPSCAKGDTLVMEVNFPSCWDGANLNSPDHKSHMAHAELRINGDILCPTSHPVPVPQIIMLFDWDLRETSSDGWYLSSDMGLPGGQSLHADWMNGWAPSILRTWHRECIVEARDCISGQLGDGRVLEPTLAFGTRKVPLPHHAAMPAEHYCNGRAATIIGTNRGEQITGTPGDDVIVGLAGRDVIDGGGGNDIICGGTGYDTINGEAGDDEIWGEGGNDIIDGGPGDDFIDAGRGNDDVRGDVGNDTLRGGLGDDVLTEFGDRNLLLGQAGDDVITGGWWIDIMYGGADDDVIDGTGGPDRIYGGAGTDTCSTADLIRSCE